MSAVFDQSEQAAFITFNRELGPPGLWNASTFTVHYSGARWETGDVRLDTPTIVRVAAVDPSISPGDETIDYDDALSTLVGTNGIAVKSFTGLPCTPVP